MVKKKAPEGAFLVTFLKLLECVTHTCRIHVATEATCGAGAASLCATNNGIQVCTLAHPVVATNLIGCEVGCGLVRTKCIVPTIAYTGPTFDLLGNVTAYTNLLCSAIQWIIAVEIALDLAISESCIHFNNLQIISCTCIQLAISGVGAPYDLRSVNPAYTLTIFKS